MVVGGGFRSIGVEEVLMERDKTEKVDVAEAARRLAVKRDVEYHSVRGRKFCEKHRVALIIWIDGESRHPIVMGAVRRGELHTGTPEATPPKATTRKGGDDVEA